MFDNDQNLFSVSGMKYLHRLNICHRDLKPENILIEKSLAESFKSGFVLKIADFGVADYFVKNGLVIGFKSSN